LFTDIPKMIYNDFGCLKIIHMKGRGEERRDNIASKITKLERHCQLLSINVKTANNEQTYDKILSMLAKRIDQKRILTPREPRIMPTFMERDVKYRNFFFLWSSFTLYQNKNLEYIVG